MSSILQTKETLMHAYDRGQRIAQLTVLNHGLINFFKNNFGGQAPPIREFEDYGFMDHQEDEDYWFEKGYYDIYKEYYLKFKQIT